MKLSGWVMLVPLIAACAETGSSDDGRRFQDVPGLMPAAAGTPLAPPPPTATAGMAGAAVAPPPAAGAPLAGSGGVPSTGEPPAMDDTTAVPPAGGTGGLGVGGAPAIDAGVATAPDAGAPLDASPPPAADAGNGGSCPPGFESTLPLVLTGDTVPGNLELGLASAPETPREPCGLPAEQQCFMLLNAERAAAGRVPLLWDGDLVDLARSHAADRSQRRYPGSQHGSSTNTSHLYQERAEFLGLKSGKFRQVVENAVTGARTAEAAVASWMGSSGHRAVVLGDGQWAPFTHAGCGGDGNEWNIEFGY